MPDKKAPKEPTAKPAQVTARVLVACTIAEVSYLPDALVTGTADVIEQAHTDGLVDPDPAAVAHAQALA